MLRRRGNSTGWIERLIPRKFDHDTTSRLKLMVQSRFFRIDIIVNTFILFSPFQLVQRFGSFTITPFVTTSLMHEIVYEGSLYGAL